MMDADTARQRLDDYFTTGKEVTYAKRALIVGYYEKPNYAYWITAGNVKVISCNHAGVERIQHIYEKNELFPLKWVFDAEQFDVAFFALNQVTVRAKPIIDFKLFIEQNPGVLMAIIQQQFAVFERIVNLHIDSAEERVVFGLLSLAPRLSPHKRDNSTGMVRLPLTIQDLAGMLHLSRETTGKVLRKLDEASHILLGRQSIIICPSRLQQLLNK